jgi:hypothetical protein
MEIDFNNVRRKAGETYNELVRFLSSKNNEGTICFDDEELDEIMQDLRHSIGAIMCTYEKGDDGFKCLYDPLLLVYGTFVESFCDEADYLAQ